MFVADLNNNRVLQYTSPLSTEGNTAKAVLGQAVFDLGFPNLVDGKGLNLPHNVTIDHYSTPNHIYVSDGDEPPESRARVVRRENFRRWPTRRPGVRTARFLPHRRQ